MKVFICCLIASVFYLALAEVGTAKTSVKANATAESTDSKQKRDASLLTSAYHGPSYKYLPPISSTYDSYQGSVGGFSGGHISGLAAGYRPVSAGHGHRHPGYSSSGNYNSHGLGHHGTASSYSGRQHGFTYPISNHYASQGSTKYYGSGLPGSAGVHASVIPVHNSHPHSYPVGHGYGSSGSSFSNLDHNLHSALGTNTQSGSGYHFSKGAGGTLSSYDTSGFGSTQGLSGSVGSSLDEEHHTGHVHNGSPEHVYVISNVPAGGIKNSHSHAGGHQENHAVATISYLPSVKQHPLPSTSYGETISTAGDSYNTKYYSQAAGGVERGPAYAAGHKGLGYFSYTANKPNVLHTSISGLSLNQPSYSKAPFKPSIFLGAKFEGNAQNNDPSQQYLSPLGEGSDSTGYDYPLPTGSSTSYQEPNYQQSVEIQAGSPLAPDSAYSNQDSLNEIPSAPSSNYLPPSNSYGVSYSD